MSSDATRGPWRSLEELAGDPAIEESRRREFPDGAAELPEGVDRRQLVQLLGASISLAGLSACRRPVEHIVPYANPPESVVPGIPRYFATTMPFSTAAYGIVVESHEGRPSKIEGNELHPSTGGASSHWIQASTLELFDPDRSKTVREGDEERTFEDFARAWTQIEGRHAASAGGGLAVLTPGFSSPSLARLADAFEARFPEARFVVWEPVSDENVEAGLFEATGRILRPRPFFDRARVILALDSDFLLTETDSVASLRGYAAGRRIEGETVHSSRLYAVESVHSVTGANAEHRLRLASGRIAPFVRRLAAELARQGLEIDVPGASSMSGVEDGWVEALASDLLEHRGESLLVAGRRQPAAVHAALFALNRALGNVGETIAYLPARDVRSASTADLVELVGAMRDGAVQTLVALGSNPVYDAPADVDFEAALSSVETLIHVGSHRDETGRLAHWHVPEAHFLEGWGDARSADGTASVIQPLIEPLFGAKTRTEILALLASGLAQPGLEIVRETWREILNGRAEGEEAAWQQVLHDGLLGGSESAAEVVAEQVRADGFAGLEDPGEVGPSDLELVFVPSNAVYDGRFANNGWLQELPDPVTKVTWDNVAQLSPATAAELGVGNEDVVRIEHGGRELELPVWLVPGQADGTVVVQLGYGRSSVGRVADGVGGNAYTLRTSGAPDFDRGVTITPTGRTHAIAQTQDHHGMEGRAIALAASLEEFREHPEGAAEGGPEKPHERSMWEEWTYEKGYQWGMTIDLNSCVGCNACVIACQSENNVPIVGREQVRNGREMHWLRIDRYFVGDEESPATAFQPVPCMQCENAPCEQVCPVAATVHDDEGLNVMVYNRCIGTRYCSNNCPYKVRRFNFFNYTKDTPETLRLANNPDVTVRSRGVMEKCTYCTQRINRAKIDAKLADRRVEDGDVRTACQQACPAGAIDFGNLLDPSSRVVARKAEPRNYLLLDMLHTKPRTSFLARITNPNPALQPSRPDGGAGGGDHSAGRDEGEHS